jgi:hypothetical protein
MVCGRAPGAAAALGFRHRRRMRRGRRKSGPQSSDLQQWQRLRRRQPTQGRRLRPPGTGVRPHPENKWWEMPTTVGFFGARSFAIRVLLCRRYRIKSAATHRTNIYKHNKAAAIYTILRVYKCPLFAETNIQK